MGKVFKEITPGVVEDVRVEYVRISSLVDQKNAEIAVAEQEASQIKNYIAAEKVAFLQYKDMQEKEFASRVTEFELDKKHFSEEKSNFNKQVKELLERESTLSEQEKNVVEIKKSLEVRELSLVQKIAAYQRDVSDLVSRTLQNSDKAKMLDNREADLIIRESVSEKVSDNNIANSQANEKKRLQLEQDRANIKIEFDLLQKQKQSLLDIRASIAEMSRLHEEKVLSSSAMLTELADKKVQLSKDIAALEIEKASNKAFEQQIKYKEGELIAWEKELKLQFSKLEK